MKKEEHRPQQKLYSDSLATRELPDVDESTALAASFRFLDSNPTIHNQIHGLITARTAAIMDELEEDPETGTFLVSRRNIRAIFAKATHETLGLVLLSNRIATETETLQRQFDDSSKESPNGLSSTIPELQR